MIHSLSSHCHCCCFCRFCCCALFLIRCFVVGLYGVICFALVLEVSMREKERESGIIFAIFVLLHSLPHDYDDYLPCCCCCCCCSLFSLFSNFVSSSSSSSFVFAPSLLAFVCRFKLQTSQPASQAKAAAVIVIVGAGAAVQCLHSHTMSDYKPEERRIFPRARKSSLSALSSAATTTSVPFGTVTPHCSSSCTLH